MDLGYAPLFFFRFIPTNDHIFYIYTHIHAFVGCFSTVFPRTKIEVQTQFLSRPRFSDFCSSTQKAKEVATVAMGERHLGISPMVSYLWS